MKQGIKVRYNEDEPDSDSVADDLSDEVDDDSEVDEQKRVSDATLKYAIEYIAAAFIKLG